ANPGRFPVVVTVRTAGGTSTTINTNAVFGTQNSRWVAQAYRDILGREADPSGLATFTRILDQGQATRTQVAAFLLSSPEHRTKALTDIYRAILKREPDAGGLTSFLGFLASGGTLNQVRALLLGSVEYFQKQGSTIDGFLTALYQDALGRPIDPSGRA